MASRAGGTRRSTRARAPRSAAIKRHVPSEQRRQQILDAAAELFAQRGFAGTTTRQIASAAGIAEMVLFRHFETKERLYAAILEHRVPEADVARWLEELRVIAERRDDEALFTTVIEKGLESFRENPVFHRLMLFAALEDRELARLGQVKYTSPVASFLREYIAQRQAEGAFKRLRPELIVHTLFSLIGHYAMWNSLGVNPLGITEEEVTSQAIALLSGLRHE
jgi:TetR/AcrR family transcriptional regulator